MGNSLDRYSPATAIPQLEKMLKALVKEQSSIKSEISSIEIPETQELYSLDIYATKGNLIQSVVSSTDLEARFYSWDTDITDTADASWFNWTRISGSDEDAVAADAEWNESHGNGKKTITIFEPDVGEQATFVCTVDNNENIHLSVQIVISCNLTLQEDISNAITSAVEQAETILKETLDGDEESEEPTGYVSKSQLGEYDNAIQAQLIKANEGYSVEFTSIKNSLEALSNDVSVQKSYIRLIDGNVYVGKYDDQINTVYTSNGLEIRYGDEVVAIFSSDTLNVKNMYTQNQMTYWNQWATRKGDDVTGKGHNLDFVWIGG